MSRKPNPVPIEDHVDDYKRIVRDALSAGRRLRKQAGVSTEKEPTEAEVAAAEVTIVEACNRAGVDATEHLLIGDKQVVSFAAAIRRLIDVASLDAPKPPPDIKPN